MDPFAAPGGRAGCQPYLTLRRCPGHAAPVLYAAALSRGLVMPLASARPGRGCEAAVSPHGTHLGGLPGVGTLTRRGAGPPSCLLLGSTL